MTVIIQMFCFLKVVVFDQANKIVYVSDDEGESYKMNAVPFKPYDVMCIGNKLDNLLLAYDEDTKKVITFIKNLVYYFIS